MGIIFLEHPRCTVLIVIIVVKNVMQINAIIILGR